MTIKGLIAILIVVLVGATTACSSVATEMSADDEIAIYAAVIRQVTGPDDTAGGTLEKPIIYLITMTNDALGDPSKTQTEPRELSAEVQEGISTALSDLPSEIRWIESRDQIEMDAGGQAVDGSVFVTLGNIHPQNDTEVLATGSIYFANLGAGGMTYVVAKQDGAWVITGNTGWRWIS